MPLGDRKIIDILLEECKAVEERCAGYRKQLIDLVADIIQAERQHMVQATNIQKKINDLCNAAGTWLAERSKEGSTA